jgi:hypothetical protein
VITVARIDVPWADGEGSYLDVSEWCTRSPAPAKPFDVYHFDGVTDIITLDVPAGTSGRITFNIKVEYRIIPETAWYLRGTAMPIINRYIRKQTGSSVYQIKWDYECTPDGQLTLTRNTTGHQFWSSAVSMVLAPVFHEAAKSADPYLTVDVALSYAEDADGSVSIEAEPVFISPPVHAPKSSGGELGLRINFKVTGKQEYIVLPVDKTIYFEHEGQPDLDRNVAPGNRLQDLQDWADGLRSNKELFEAIAKRYVPIHLRGYASKTDTGPKNFDLSAIRVQNVQERLAGTAGGQTGDAGDAGRQGHLVRRGRAGQGGRLGSRCPARAARPRLPQGPAS